VDADEIRCPKCGRYFSFVKCPKCGFTGDESLFQNGCPSCFYSASKPLSGGGAPTKRPRQDNWKKNLEIWLAAAIAVAIIFLLVIFLF